jgi:hypothetical protein
VGLTGLTQALLFADRIIHDMYGFHINGFVVDLVFTPGGIDSLGADDDDAADGGGNRRPAGGGAGRRLRLAWCAATAWRAGRSGYAGAGCCSPPWLVGTGERVAYAYSAAANYQPILFASERYPLLPAAHHAQAGQAPRHRIAQGRMRKA